jgi:hypothetical protein
MTVSLPNDGDSKPPPQLKPEKVTDNNDDNVSAWRHGLDEQLRNVHSNNNKIWMNPISNNNFTCTNYDMSPKQELFSISENISSLDECLDKARACSEEQFSITSLIRGHGKPKKKKRKRCNLKPIVQYTEIAIHDQPYSGLNEAR